MLRHQSSNHLTFSIQPILFDQYCQMRNRTNSMCAIRSKTGNVVQGHAHISYGEFYDGGKAWFIEDENGVGVSPYGDGFDCWMGYWHPLRSGGEFVESDSAYHITCDR